MGCITGFLFLCNIGVIITADVLLWMYSATMGLFGLFGVIVFLSSTYKCNFLGADNKQ